MTTNVFSPAEDLHAIVSKRLVQYYSDATAIEEEEALDISTKVPTVDLSTMPSRCRILYKILNGYSILSIRLIEWFLVNYTKLYDTCYINSKTKQFTNIHIKYKGEQREYHKREFDPFCRTTTAGKIQNTQILFPCGPDCFLKTTLAQLEFYKWFIENDAYRYMLEHRDEIDRDMHERNTANHNGLLPQVPSLLPQEKQKEEKQKEENDLLASIWNVHHQNQQQKRMNNVNITARKRKSVMQTTGTNNALIEQIRNKKGSHNIAATATATTTIDTTADSILIDNSQNDESTTLDKSHCFEMDENHAVLTKRRRQPISINSSKYVRRNDVEIVLSFGPSGGSTSPVVNSLVLPLPLSSQQDSTNF